MLCFVKLYKYPDKISLLETLLQKFYAASISVAVDGSMLVTSTTERIMVWGMVFCFIAAMCLICLLIWRDKRSRKISLAFFVVSLSIPVFIMPSVKHEYIRVSPRQITVDTGSWYIDSKTVFQFAELDHITERQSGLIPGNLLGDPRVNWQFSWKDGNQVVLELNDFFNAHRMVIAHYIKDHGYIIERLEDQSDFVF